jgi:hypothetical protein
MQGSGLMSVEKEDDRAQADATPLAPGVWETEAPGFASVPPRAQSDLCEAQKQDEAKAEQAREQETEPRIEKYRER